MSTKNCLVSVAVAVALTATCKQWEKGDLRTRPQELIVFPGANRIDYRVGGEAQAITYEAPIEYPAEGAIRTIAQGVSRLGYQPLREHPMNPGIRSAYVRGWVDFVDATRNPKVRVYQWIGDWLGPHGEWLEYSLAYEFENGNRPQVGTLKVMASRMPKDQAEQVIAAAAGPARAQQINALVIRSPSQPVVYGIESPHPQAK